MMINITKLNQHNCQRKLKTFGDRSTRCMKMNYQYNGGEHRESVHVAFPGTDTCIQRISLPRYTEEEPWLLNINLNANNTGPYQSRH